MENETVRIPVELKDVDPLHGLDLDVRREFSDFFLPEDRIEAVGEMEAHIHISASGADYFVTGNVKGSVKTECGRCLKKYVEDLEAEINAPFLPKSAMKVDDGEEVEPDEADAYYYGGERLELFDLLREQLLLSMPVKPLCDESCKGLCPNCGADLNVEKCGCSVENTDSRFEALKKLKEKLKN